MIDPPNRVSSTRSHTRLAASPLKVAARMTTASSALLEIMVSAPKDAIVVSEPR